MKSYIAGILLMVMTAYQVIHAQGVNISPSSALCSLATVEMRASFFTNIDERVISYTWYKNNTYAAEREEDSYTFHYLREGDIISCTVLTDRYNFYSASYTVTTALPAPQVTISYTRDFEGPDGQAGFCSSSGILFPCNQPPFLLVQE